MNNQLALSYLKLCFYFDAYGSPGAVLSGLPTTPIGVASEFLLMDKNGSLNILATRFWARGDIYHTIVRTLKKVGVPPHGSYAPERALGVLSSDGPIHSNFLRNRRFYPNCVYLPPHREGGGGSARRAGRITACE
jgi:hypothetical protein